jgi:hypothetical protein
MQAHELVFSKAFKGLICVALVVSVAGFLWRFYSVGFADIRSGAFFGEFGGGAFLDSMGTLLLMLLLFVAIVLESRTFLRFLRSRAGVVITWSIVVVLAWSSFAYPVNVVVAALLVSVFVFHYIVRPIMRGRTGPPQSEAD